MGTQEDIQQRINGRLTIEANLVEGGFSQDIIGSVSYELANIYDTELNNLTDRAFVRTAKGIDLDNVGADYGIPRRQESKAIVELEIEGDEGYVVNSSVKAIYNNLIYTVQEQKEIDSTGKVTVKAECETPGSVGNVPANTITEFLTDYGLISVTNPNPAYDGFDEEDDDTYRARILLYLSEDAANCNEAQYKQWALEVTGVKKAVVQGAEVVGAGNVGVYISSMSGTVSQELIDTVKEYIEEKQFINATVIVQALTDVGVDVDATLIITAGYNVSDIGQEFAEKLQEYLDSVTTVVSYFKISDLLYSCSGVEDVTSYTLNNDTDSIQIADTENAVVGDITIAT